MSLLIWVGNKQMTVSAPTHHLSIRQTVTALLSFTTIVVTSFTNVFTSLCCYHNDMMIDDSKVYQDSITRNKMELEISIIKNVIVKIHSQLIWNY
jgi:hypothetical protein